MNLQRVLSVGAVGLSALMCGTAAQAEIWAFTYTGPGINASGTFTTAGAAITAENILSITGSRNGVAITGLVPLGTDPNFIYDNQFSATAPNFTDGGMLFSLAGGDVNTNVYFFETGYFEVRDGTPEVEISWSVTAVPEPATVLSMLAGLGMLGVYMRKARAST